MAGFCIQMRRGVKGNGRFSPLASFLFFSWFCPLGVINNILKSAVCLFIKEEL